MILQHKLSTFLDATPKFQFDTTTEGHAGSVAACGTACSVGQAPVQHFLVDLVACAAQLPRQVATSAGKLVDLSNSTLSVLCFSRSSVAPHMVGLAASTRPMLDTTSSQDSATGVGAHDISATAAAERCTAWGNRRHEVFR